jgi:hypothetical protein
VAAESSDVRSASAELARRPPETTLEAVERIPDLRLPARHALFPEIDGLPAERRRSDNMSGCGHPI